MSFPPPTREARGGWLGTQNSKLRPQNSLARISHRVPSRGRRYAAPRGVFDLRGAEREAFLVAIADPELSNFRFARERWQLIPEEGGTVLIYDFEMEPDFWVPPVVGPYVVKRAMRSGGISAVDRIEALAQGKEPEE